MSITICHITGRREPRWEYFVDSICRQATPEELSEIQFIFVDAKLWGDNVRTGTFVDVSLVGRMTLGREIYHDPERIAKLSKIVRSRFEYSHIPPLPNVFQGPFRLTGKDWFYAGLNRNTGIIAAKNDYVMFCDDLAWPAPTWLAQVRHAADHKYLLAGQYKKVKKLVVEDGVMVSHEEFPPGVDSRWPHGSPVGIVPWHGSGVYGCSFGAPLESLLEVDGNGRETAMQGAEDYCLGIRLERTGLKVMLNQNCLTLESEEDHHTEPSLPRESKIVWPNRLPRGYVGNPMSDHVHLNRLRSELGRVTPLFPNGLRGIRDRYLTTGMVPVPTEPSEDWRDGQPLSEL